MILIAKKDDGCVCGFNGSGQDLLMELTAFLNAINKDPELKGMFALAKLMLEFNGPIDSSDLSSEDDKVQDLKSEALADLFRGNGGLS